MTNTIATDMMWNDAVTDMDAVARRGLVVRAKIALAGSWPVLAAATSQEDFEHRLALLSEQITSRTPPEVLDEVVAGLRADWQASNTQREQKTSMRREAALKIALQEGEESLPAAYVHVHKHAGDSAEDTMYQVDHIGSPTFIQTVGHFGDHDEAMQHAREFGLPHGLPIYEDGRFVEARARQLLRMDEEFFHEASGKWVKVDDLDFVQRTGRNFGTATADVVPPFARDAGVRPYLDRTSLTPGGTTGWTADLQVAETYQNGRWVPSANQSTMSAGDRSGPAYWADNWDHVAAKDYQPGQRIPSPSMRLYEDDKGRHNVDYVGDAGFLQTLHRGYDPEEARSIATKFSTERGVPVYTKDGRHVMGAYQPDPDAAWRYQNYNWQQPVPGVGGQPTAGGEQGVATPIGPPSNGPDGFPTDYAQGEYDGAAAKIQEQITPGPWSVTPGSEWPMRPNAATPDQTPVFAKLTPVQQAEAILRRASKQPAANDGKASLACGHAECVVGLPCKRQDPNYWTSRGAKIGSYDDGDDHSTSDDFNGSDKPYWKCGDCGSSNYSHGSTCNNCGAKGAKQGSRHTAQARECDIHKYEDGTPGVPAKYDGKTVYGPWANMCEQHARTHGADKPGGPFMRPLKEASRRQANSVPGLTALLTQMKDGDRRSVSTNNGNHSYSVGYNSEQALGDDNKPAKGYTVGAYSVSHDQSGQSLGYYRHTPHGPTLMGAKGYAAEQAADVIARHARDHSQHSLSSRHQAGEGIVPTPGPNPNYFSQGTQGLQGDAAFPENPSSAIEPKTDNNLDDLYGGVPPQQSSGTSQGQADDGGYSRQGVTGANDASAGARDAKAHISAGMYPMLFRTDHTGSQQEWSKKSDAYQQAYQQAWNSHQGSRGRLGFPQGRNAH